MGVTNHYWAIPVDMFFEQIKHKKTTLFKGGSIKIIKIPALAIV